jgi:hypothetical protein
VSFTEAEDRVILMQWVRLAVDGGPMSPLPWKTASQALPFPWRLCCARSRYLRHHWLR